MKNIHVLPTDQPSRLYKNIDGEIGLTNIVFRQEDGFSQNQHIYITSDEEIISSKDWFIDIKDKRNHLHQVGYGLDSYEWTEQYDPQYYKKIILTTDSTLLADGVQAIDDEFLEWFIKNPSCEFVEVDEEKHFEVDKSKRANPLNGFYYSHKLIIPQEEPKTGYVKSKTEFLGVEFTLKDGSKQFVPIQETLEEAAEKYCLINNIPTDQMIVKNDRSCEFETPVTMFLKGANYQAERMYSEEDIEKAHFAGKIGRESFNIWFEQFKKK